MFLLIYNPVPALAQREWEFDEPTQQAYHLALNLETDSLHQLLQKPSTVQEHYVLALAEALELLITEDTENYTDYEARFNQRLERKVKSNNADELLLQAEIRLHWVFVYLKFGHEFDAALNLRQAYLITQDIKTKFPDYVAVKKISGLLEVIMGSVPEKYNWVLSLLGMQGSVASGIDELESLAAANHALSMEASLVHALIEGFVLQQPDNALAKVKTVLETQPANRLALFLGSSLAIKNAQSEVALDMLLKLTDKNHTGLPVYYADYLKGEVYLHKAEYLNAITSYKWFTGHYAGQNYVKDATYKIGLCYWLNGNESDARVIFKQARALGKELVEADKHAARSLAANEMPHRKLTQARYATDGGYFTRGHELLQQIIPSEMTTKRNQVEWYYRQARLAHKQNEINKAKTLYEKTIVQNGEEAWYFAPNACLQLGYIAQQEKNKTTARDYFEKALSYKKHEYKNSIDSKARSALAQLNRK